MDAREVMIAWTPLDRGYGRVTDGMVKVGPWPDRVGWSDPYTHTAGACFFDFHSLTAIERAMMVFLEFHTMVVRDGVDPLVAHREFLKIRDYRKHIAVDMEGASE